MKKSNNIYYFRLNIDRQLRVYFKRVEIKKSLDTKDYNIATFKKDLVYSKYQYIVKTIKMNVLSSEQIQELVNKFIIDTLEQDITGRTTEKYTINDTNDVIDSLNYMIKDEIKYLTRNNYESIFLITKQLLIELGIEFTPSKLSHKLFQEKLLQGQLTLLKELFSRAKMRFAQYDSVGCKSNVIVEPQIVKTYIQAYEEYKIYYNDQQASQNTKNDTFRVLDKLLILVGKNTIIANTKLTDLIKIKQKIENLPNFNYKEYNKLSFEEILKLDDIPMEKKITDSRAKDYIKHIKKFFGFCYNNKIISFDPSVNLHITVSSDKKDRFTDDEVNKLFSLFDLQEPLVRFLLYIYSYTGMRREELYNSSIQGENGIVYFEIRDGKNEFAKRRIPLHNRLIELELTNDILISCQEKYSAERLGRLFNETIKPQVTDNKSKTLHCFRHTIATKLQANGVPDNLIQNILGHSAKDTLNKVYAREKINLVALRDAINVIDF